MVTGASGGRGDPGSAQRRSGWKDAGAAAAIFALAGLVRLAVLQEIRPIPSFDHLLIDAAAYDAWARRIAAGDWWGNQVFYQAPAYPYFIAAVYRLLGAEVAALHAVQMLVGALSCAGIFVATRLLFGRAAGVAAGVLLAVYPPAVFFDAIIQKTSLGLLLTSGLLVALVAFQRRPRALWLLLAGILLGLLALTRENALIWIPCVLAWLVLRFRSETLTRRLLFTACLGLGLAVTLGPVALRNHALGGTFAVTTSQLGTNFFPHPALRVARCDAPGRAGAWETPHSRGGLGLLAGAGPALRRRRAVGLGPPHALEARSHLEPLRDPGHRGPLRLRRLLALAQRHRTLAALRRIGAAGTRRSGLCVA
jgi:4-amino-4-deoxy-L-arabinose transferase-like glycosyltransferase